MFILRPNWNVLRFFKDCSQIPTSCFCDLAETDWSIVGLSPSLFLCLEHCQVVIIISIGNRWCPQLESRLTLFEFVWSKNRFRSFMFCSNEFCTKLLLIFKNIPWNYLIWWSPRSNGLVVRAVACEARGPGVRFQLRPNGFFSPREVGKNGSRNDKLHDLAHPFRKNNNNS